MLPEWTSSRPSTTIVGTRIIAGPGTSVFVKGGVSRQDRPGAYEATHEQMATLQSYPVGFRWSKHRTGEQVGNAVPPLIATKILEGFYE